MADILIIDDDRASTDQLQRALADHGYGVRVAPSSQLGIRLSRRHRPAITIVEPWITNTDGYDILRTLATERATRAIIVLSRKNTEMDKVLAFSCGADAYVTKPYLTPELVARVEAILRRTEPTTMP